MNKEIRIVVESRKIPSRIVQFKFSPPNPSQPFFAAGVTKFAVMYDYVLDAGQSEALDHARELAAASGACFQIVDLARESAIRRVIRRIIRRSSDVPLVTFAGPDLAQRVSLHPSHAASHLRDQRAGGL